MTVGGLYLWQLTPPPPGTERPSITAPTTAPETTPPATTEEPQYSSFWVGIDGDTTNETFSQSGSVSNAQRSSAEWIAEAPSGGSVLPLADFGTVDFTDCTANGQAIDTFAAADTDEIDMATKHGVAKATTSTLGNDGESFSVDWLSTGP